ncbi:DUF1573 domain-containing protein [Thermodesulfobacteriota bacterium]
MFSLKRYLSFAILVVVFSFSMAYAEPQLYIEHKEHDFGNMEQHQTMTHTFVIENKGDDALEIEKVKCYCSCTTISLESNSLSPGERSEVEVTFKSGKFKGDVKKTIYIETNEKPKSPPVKMPQDALNFDQKEEQALGRIHQIYIKATIIFSDSEETTIEGRNYH